MPLERNSVVVRWLAQRKQTYDETETSGSTGLTVLHDDALEQVSKAPIAAGVASGITNVDHISVSGEGLYIRKQERGKREAPTKTKRNKRTWCRRSSVVFHERLPRMYQNRNHETKRERERERETRQNEDVEVMT